MAVTYTARRAPSLQTLTSHLQIDKERATLIRDLLKGRVDILSFDSARKRDRQSYNPHQTLTLLFEALNEALEGYGVEYIRAADDTMRHITGLEYVNQGDTYATTLLYDHGRDSWHCCSWGDIVERNSKRFDDESQSCF